MVTLTAHDGQLLKKRDSFLPQMETLSVIEIRFMACFRIHRAGRRDCWLRKGRKDRAAQQGTADSARHTASAILLHPVSYCTSVPYAVEEGIKEEYRTVCGWCGVGWGLNLPEPIKEKVPKGRKLFVTQYHHLRYTAVLFITSGECLSVRICDDVLHATGTSVPVF